MCDSPRAYQLGDGSTPPTAFNHQLTVELPPNITIGDLFTAQGALLDAAAAFIDWDLVHEGGGEAISPPGRVLLSIAAQLQQRAAH